MPREVARKIERDPAGIHTLIKRDSTGTVQMNQAGTGSANLSATNNTTLGTVTANSPNLVGNTSATVTVQSGDISATNTNANLTIARNGTDLASTTITGTGADVTLSTSATLTTPDNAPTWTFKGDVAGGTLSNVSWTASRDDRWV